MGSLTQRHSIYSFKIMSRCLFVQSNWCLSVVWPELSSHLDNKIGAKIPLQYPLKRNTGIPRGQSLEIMSNENSQECTPLWNAATDALEHAVQAVEVCYSCKSICHATSVCCKPWVKGAHAKPQWMIVKPCIRPYCWRKVLAISFFSSGYPDVEHNTNRALEYHL